MFTPDEERQLAEIAHNQNKIRAESFIRGVEYPFEIGVEVLPLTLRSFNLLRFSGNSFILGGPIDETDITQFLFLLRKDQKLSLKEIALKVVGNETVLANQIFAFIDDAFTDAQEGGDGAGVAWTNFEFQAVHLLASNYHWDESQILDLPLARLFQYINLVGKDLNPEHLPLDRYTRARATIIAGKGKLAHE